MSIRARLLIITLVAMLLAVTLVARRYVQEREHHIQHATQRLPAVAAGIAAMLDEKIQGTAQLQFGLARADDLDTGDRTACSRFLSRVRDKHPQYTGILTIEPDGQLFCDSLATGRDLDLRDRLYFQRARDAKDNIVMQPAFGRLTGLAVLQVAYPVRSEEGVLKRVLLASLNLVRLARAHAQDPTMPDLQLLVLDHAGLLLTRTNARPGEFQPGASLATHELFRFANAQPQGGVREITRADGRVQVWAVASTALTREAGIHILAGRSSNAIVATANRQFTEDLALLAGGAALLFLAVWAFSEVAIRRHVGTIAGMVRRFGGNDRTARIPQPHPRGELGELMGLLNQMAEAQEAQQAAIEDLNDRLRVSQRLEAVGQLTGGIAHDFNNLLTVILGNAEMLNERLAGQPRLAPLAGMVVEAAERGAELTQRLLAFARKQALEPRAVDVNAQVAALDALLRRTLGEHIEIAFDSGAEPCNALVDPSQLDSAVLNLCLNARDAMPDGGRLTIETANVQLGPDYAALWPDVQVGDYVLLAVSDTGSGIAPEHLSRVFEPFFTTKEQGKGTGLGLAMIYGLIKQSGGHITVYSELGQGTTVKLYLPCTREPVSIDTRKAGPAQAQGGIETILLVEDDALVRRYAQDQLRALGYEVIETENGVQALAVLRSGRAVDLLFTDVVMPGMSGPDLAHAALALRPGLKVLYTSGYTENAIVHNGRLDAGVHLLSKPYRRDDLARRVREAL
jgi:signal transduction histidine kinase